MSQADYSVQIRAMGTDAEGLGVPVEFGNNDRNKKTNRRGRRRTTNGWKKGL